MIKTVIIEDDKATMKLLKRMLNNIKHIDIVGVAMDGKSAKKVIKKTHPNLIFLDIELPDINGFDLLAELEVENTNFSVVIVTAYKDYAIQAIKVGVTDYILKPLRQSELKNAVDKFLASNRIQGVREKPHALKGYLRKSPTSQTHVVLPSSKDYKVVDPQDIIRCESDSYYTQVYLKNGQTVLVSKTLKEFEAFLKDLGFIRPHNSHLVNVNHIKNYDRTPKEAHILLSNGERIPVSRRRKVTVKKYLLSLNE